MWMILFTFFPSVSSALLPHAAAEETGSSRRGHSGEGWLDKPPPLTFCLPPHRPHCPYFMSTSSLAPSAITSSLHGTGRAAQMTTCLARAVASDNQESVIPGFISIRVVILETCLQFQCCLSLRRKPDESFVRPPVLLHLVASAKGFQGNEKHWRTTVSCLSWVVPNWPNWQFLVYFIQRVAVTK